MGLTEIPIGIPCNIAVLYLPHNQLTRLEANEFTCLSNLKILDVGYNIITYIAPGAFDPLLSLHNLRLRGNSDLVELPPNFGPNTINMKALYMKRMNLQIIPPNSYWAQMPNITTYETSISFYNDFFNGWNSLKTLFSFGSVAPNLTDRAPNIVHLNMWTNGVNIPSENVYNLERLENARINKCTQLPTFEGAVSLKTISFSYTRPCRITSLPDYRHLVSLETLVVDTSQYYCDTASCWMLLETISNPALSLVVAGTVCTGPEEFVGYNVTELSPVQTRCFEGKYEIFHSFNGAAFTTKTPTYVTFVWNTHLSVYGQRILSEHA